MIVVKSRPIFEFDLAKKPDKLILYLLFFNYMVLSTYQALRFLT